MRVAVGDTLRANRRGCGQWPVAWLTNFSQQGRGNQHRLCGKHQQSIPLGASSPLWERQTGVCTPLLPSTTPAPSPFPSQPQSRCSQQDSATAGDSLETWLRSPLLVSSKLKFISQEGNEGVRLFCCFVFFFFLMGPDEGNECGEGIRNPIYR